MAGLRTSLTRILEEYREAVAEPFAQHPLASFIRKNAPTAVTTALDGQLGSFKIEGSAGAGNWATVPWISVFDLTVTDTATRGYYIVYLFHHLEPIVHLSLNQGTTAVRKEFGSHCRNQMRSRSELIRSRVADLTGQFRHSEISLGSNKSLPLDYEAAHSFGVSYHLSNMPSEDKLIADLRGMASIYRALTFRGGIDQTDENLRDDVSADNALTESRRYRLHRRIERNSSVAALVKKRLGCRCQACGLDFSERYGEIGDGFIEVHHLTPLSSLAEDTIVKYSIETDFAVLCANCHRMIHRWIDPSDLQGFTAKLKSRL